MRWKPAISVGGILAAIAALAVWQAHEYGHECQLARETVSSSADSVMSALVGGVRSHRRLGTFFSENIQGVLDGLVQSSDVLAAAVISGDGATVLSAGDAALLALDAPPAPGEHWDAHGFRRVAEFSLPRETAEGRGAGRGGGAGRGRGWRWAQDGEDTVGAFAPGQKALVVLVVDRRRADRACRRAARLRSAIVLAGSLVAISVALVWRSTVRLAEARERERSLAAEARHLRELGQAAAGLAHETRNPLGLIRGWTQRLAESDHVSSDGRRQARAVVEECDRVTARINQFLAFARPSAPQPQRMDPNGLVEELAALLEPDLAAKQLAFRPARCEGTVVADRELLRQALFNLLQNAVQSSPDGACVELALVRGRDGTARFELSDRGPGVPEALVAKLFTPYFTTRAGGTGLGLAIVRRIAAAHGWEAGYAPRPGGGAVFFLAGIHG